MKTLFRNHFSSLTIVALSLAAAAALNESQAQIVTLTDANSSAQVNVGGQQGMFNWTVDGQNQLNQQWFWFRVGNTAEHSIDTIGGLSIFQPQANVLTATYQNGNFSVSTTYTLRGGQAGSGASDIGESIVINNKSSSNHLDFHFFQYSDFRISGTPANDYTQLGVSPITHLFNEAAVWDSVLQVRENVDTAVSPGANHGEVAAVGATLGRLNDASATTLNDVSGPLGPSYNTWAFEWDLDIGPNGSVIISKDKNLQAVVIPEPSALALLSASLIALAIRRSSRR